MTSRAIVALAIVATGFLVLGARLLDAPTAVSAVFGALSIVVGTAAAATAVAGAWRTPVPLDPSQHQPSD